MTIFPYNNKFKERARELRKKGTLGEALLWNKLKGSKIAKTKFTRQKPIDNYIVDFFSKELLLAIEIDGASHDNKLEEDRYRQERLEIMGIYFIRFTEMEVRKKMKNVLLAIERKINSLRVSPRGECRQ
jgi:very-short-patch-repair endonuclease